VSAHSAGAASAWLRERFVGLGHVLPQPPVPVGAYRAVVMRGALGVISGQFPWRDGKLAWCGRVGAELDEAQGCEAARQAALNALSQLACALDGLPTGWTRFSGLLRLEGYVASADGFVAQPRVLDAASRLLVEVLGEDLGAHARAAFAPRRLPLDAAVELVLSFSLRSENNQAPARD
jgi:enamine deaminase RidA (YjgF/YER057c/UK114 family)